MSMRNQALLASTPLLFVLACATSSPQPTVNFAEAVMVQPGDTVTRPEVVKRDWPAYNQFAQAGVTGIVRVKIRVERDGTVGDVTVLDAVDQGLATATVEAVKQWQFRPATLNGEPLAAFFEVTQNLTASR